MEKSQMRIAVIDDEEDIRVMVSRVLQAEGHGVYTASDGRGGLELIAKVDPDLAFIDLKMVDMDGIEVTREALKMSPDLAIVIVTGYGSIESAVEAMNAGASNYLKKPLDPDELTIAVEKVQERISLVRENQVLKSLQESAARGERYLTNNKEVKAILAQADQVAETDSTVLITGESGTGKEVLAKYIHKNSDRSERQFVVVNCASLSEQLLESELFGHVRGAYTGAVSDRKGYFEMADSGTIFLDEIAEIGPPLQVKLLRVLQEKEFTRVGDTKVRSTDIRFVAATNCDPKTQLAKGKLREDFYYRINVFALHLPPLRERPEDVVPYFEQFVREFSSQMNKSVTEIDPEVKGALTRYDWPGNIRELRNIAERMTILCQDERVTTDLMPMELRSRPTGTGRGFSHNLRESKEALIRDFETEFITRHLRLNRGNVAATARQIGMHPVSLRQKIARLKIDPWQIRSKER